MFMGGWVIIDTYFSISNEIVEPWMVDFSREFGTKHFDENSARKLIHTNISLDVNFFSKNNDILIDDDVALDDAPYNYFINTNSSYLQVRCNRT